MTIDRELDSFFEDLEKHSKRLRLIIDDFDVSKYDYKGMKLSDIKPVYSNNKVKIYIAEKKGLKGKLF